MRGGRTERDGGGVGKKGQRLRSSVERNDVDIKVSYVNYVIIVVRLGVGEIGWFRQGSFGAGTMNGALTWLRIMVSGFPGINISFSFLPEDRGLHCRIGCE